MVFVFGSNLDGIHGAGAAKYAHKELGAQWGVGEGMTGATYALPTKGHKLSYMSLEQIDPYIKNFLDYAKENPSCTFALTPIGTGLAGHRKKSIWGILEKYGVPKNVYLTSTWVTE